MEESLIFHLTRIARNYQITLTAKNAPDCFIELIESLHEQSNNKKVVILVDEYDKPITAHLMDSHLETIRIDVHNFYQVMKSSDEHLKFVFLTGVSNFSGLSIFSALNNPRDITLHESYATICGYTQEELESNFSEYIDRAAEYLKMTRKEVLKQIRYWYNGYTWDGETAIYNPFSTMNFFDNKIFDNYWFSTGTPTFLMDIIQRRNNTNIVLEPIVVDSNVFRGYEPTNIDEIPLLFQTGYLTIKQRELIGGIPLYTLGIPNMEVNESLLLHLLTAYGKYPDDRYVNTLRRTIQHQITNADATGFADSLNSLFASIPSGLHIPQESCYHSLSLMWLNLVGFKPRGEEHTSIGRLDMVWEQPNLTVIVEMKYHAKNKIDTLLKAAMKQIHDKRYYDKYSGKILLIGMAISGRQSGCCMEELKR
jgi:hypothetical protein